MVSTVAPADMMRHREQFMQLTGLAGDDVGIVPDKRHKEGGGYHCGCQDIVAIGKYPSGDYSTRQTRDRVGGNTSSAMDKGDNWPNGGRAAWLRYNNLVVKQMMRGDPELVTLRAVNFSPDGVQRKRYDTLHPEAGIIDSTDNVDIHTHEEHWRNTAGTPERARTLARLIQIARAAINKEPLDGEDDDDMGQTFIDAVPPYEVLEGRAYTFSPGLVGSGLADPRDTWVSIGADTFGAPFAVRAMQTDGNPDANGNVGWKPLFKDGNGKGVESVVVRSGERKGIQVELGTTLISISHQAVVNGKPVNPDPKKGTVPEWAGSIAILVERGPVKH